LPRVAAAGDGTPFGKVWARGSPVAPIGQSDTILLDTPPVVAC
jgi:hypothetical protein